MWPGLIGFAVGLTTFGVLLLGILPGLAVHLGEFTSDMLATLGM